MPRREEVLGSEDPERKARLGTESGRKETTEWMGLGCKLAAGAQILGQGTENEAINFLYLVMKWNYGMEWRLVQEEGGFVWEIGRWNQCKEMNRRVKLWGM